MNSFTRIQDIRSIFLICRTNPKIFFFSLFALISTMGYSANRYSVATGNWNSTSTWSSSSGGASGASVPVAGDVVIIEGGDNVTINVSNAACASIQLGSPTSGGGAGTLTFAANSQITVSGAVILGNTGSSSRTGTITMTNGGILICNSIESRSNNDVFTEGTGTVQLNATNTLAATDVGGEFSAFTNLIINNGTTTLARNTTLSGSLTVKAGAILAKSTFTLGSPTSVVLECGATSGSVISGSAAFTLGGNITVNNAGTGTSGASISSPVALGAARTFTVADDGTSADDLSISGIISGSFAISKAGAGQMVISGANTYTGATNITAGTLKLGVSSSSSTSGPVGTNAGGVIVSSGATFDLNGFSLTSSATEALSLSGTGVGGNGALVNNAATTSTYIGVITFTAAAKISGENGLIAITGTPASGTTGITLSGATGGSISTVIAGNRTLSKEDVGNWTLSGNNTYSGATTISAGKIVLNPGSNATPATQYILNGGSISTQGITANRTITSSKTLRLDDNSEINLGSTAHTLTFATSNGETWATNKQLTITGWVGGYNGTAGTAGKIFIGNSASGLTSSQLLKIQFYDGATYYPAMLLSTGQLVPFSNTIATGTISNSTFCEGETGINVPFTYSSASSFTGATFTAQLSNSTGSFTSPVILQSVASNGSGSQSISVTIPLGTAAGSAYRIRVVSNTPAVNGSDNGSNLTVNVYPSAAGSISGSSSVCQGQSGVSYTVGTISNAATYSWSYTGTGASISGTGNSVSISFSASATAGDLTVMGVNSCGNGSVSATFPVSVNPLPNAAGIITGTTLVSQGQTNVGFSVGNISNATSYVWSYSGSGATISGSGSSITISFSGSASSGNVSVYGQNSCGNGTASTFAVTVAGNKVSISSGSWYTSSNWSPSGVPTATDNVTISHAITLDNTPTAICNNLTLGVSGTLQIYGGFSLTVNGTLTNNAGEYGLIINSDGSLLNNTAGVSATVERYITNDNKWHFISSPVANQAIWPEFAPDPGSGLNFGTSWNWDFYYWNPNSFLANNLYWVNLRKNTAGDYNNSNVDQGGSYAGFGTTTPPTFTSGRGYLVAYNSNWNPSTGSPEYHYFGGSLHAGTVNRNIVTGANYFNLVGNPFASSIDWKASSGWSRSALESSGGGYDYWIYNDNLSTGNYGVFNSSGTSGTNGVTRYIAPQQAFFVKAASDGVLGMGYEVRTHSSQSWLKGADAENSLVRLKITNDANSYSDEMIVEFNPEFTGGGSDKFWSFYASAPEIFVNKEGSNYSIARYRNTSEEQIINIGVKTGVQANYTLSASNINDFNLSNRVLLEDLVSGQVTDLKQNPSYTFEAGEGSNGNRFRLIIGSTIGIDEPGQNGFDIYANNGNLYLTNKEFKGVYTLRVSNLLGQTLLERQLDGSSAQLIRLNEVPGVYIATVHSNGKSFSQKFVIR